LNGLLRQKLWVQYLIRSKSSYLDLLSLFNAGKDKIAEIVSEAKAKRTKWGDVISIFNERFSVPFVVRIDNQEDVILKSDAPSICFDFLKNPDDQSAATAPIEETDLIKLLSNGERRALYILNIIFEVEARRSAKQPSLFIVDDIADSFDYKNKYAIIEYLKDISEVDYFRLLILSHNFDFFRTVASRFNLLKKRDCLLSVEKTNADLKLKKEYYHNPFKYWRTQLTNEKILIASIPFLRNLAEFSGDGTCHTKLTSLLHMKSDTARFSVSDLEELIKRILHDQANLSLPNPDSTVKDLIYQVASSIASNTTNTAVLEDKVTLSIAIRLKAEEFMISKIDDEPFWQGISRNQTITLIKRFKDEFPGETNSIQLIEQVNLMTPENIHLNSFMYEPILDLSAQHLKRLYTKIKAL